MAQYEDPLSSVKIASPCSADWEDMIGNDRSRFCGQCDLNVYNLSEMTKHEAERLINQTEGRLCVRFYRRTDGTILTRDCPVGLRAIKRRISKVRNAVVSSVLGFIAGLGFYEVAYQTEPQTTMGVMREPVRVMGTVPQNVDTPRADLGKLAVPPIDSAGSTKKRKRTR